MSTSQASPKRSSPARAILISGMKRSGTTVLWETLRKDSRNLCFDEPFHPSLWQGKKQNGKGTWTELGSKFNQLATASNMQSSPIRPIDELTHQNGPGQRRYLRDLMLQAQRTVIDEVRLWNRLPEILPEEVPVVVVHLLRDPVNWVTAQMMPSVGRSKKSEARFLAWLGKIGFFWRRSDYDSWRYEEIFEAAIAADHPLFRFVPRAMCGATRLPAYQKLIALWWAANLETRSRLSTRHLGPVVNVSLFEFSVDPEKVTRKIYSAAGWDLPSGLIDFQHVCPIRPSWKARSIKWERAFTGLGLPTALSQANKLDGDALVAILDRHRSDTNCSSPETLI